MGMRKEIKMSVPTTEEGWQLEMEILQMLEDGLIEICGDNNKGEPLLRITEKGRRMYEALETDQNNGDK
jgi:hypothetical protein